MADPLDAAGPALVRVSGLVESRYARATAGEGISVQQSRILVFASRGARNMIDIGTEFGLSKSTTTGVIDRLEAAGLLERRPDPADRRRLIVAPTERGAELAARVVGEVRGSIVRLLAPVPVADRVELARILTTVLDHASDDDG